MTAARDGRAARSGSRGAIHDGAAGDTDELMDVLVQTSFLVMAGLTRIAAEHQLSLTQLRVLAILRDRRPGMTALAAHLGLEKSTMSGLVDRAEKRGLLQRGTSPVDGRAVEVSLTAAGVELADRIRVQVARVYAPTLARLGREDQQRAQDLLARLLDPA